MTQHAKNWGQSVRSVYRGILENPVKEKLYSDPRTGQAFSQIMFGIQTVHLNYSIKIIYV